jgi:hypothetical protein
MYKYKYMEKRMSFNSIFRTHPDGSIEPLRPVRIGGVQMGQGVRFGRGVSFGGVDLYQYIGHDFSVQEQGGVLIIVGIY